MHRFVASLLVTLALAAGLYVAAGVSLIPFSPGTAIKSADVNANFSALADALDAKQERVTGACIAGSAIRAVAADGTVTCEVAGPAGGWLVTGNAATAGHFLGTTTNVPLELRVNGVPALRLLPHATYPSVVGGATTNVVTEGAWSASIGGGHGNTVPNVVGSTIAGGWSNYVGGDFSAIGGGLANAAAASATISGGTSNTASGTHSAIGGGSDNVASAAFSMVPGGHLNVASGPYSFAAGRRGNAVHTGAFVWAGGVDATISSPADNTFSVRAPGGIWFGTTNTATVPAGRFINTSTGAHLTSAGVWTNSSDRALKRDITSVDGRLILATLVDVPLHEWTSVAEPDGVRHLGPMAQDFHAAFGLGASDSHIGTVDADGVALAAIQGLYALVLERDATIAALHERLATQATAHEALARRLDVLEALLPLPVATR
jgi:hypothetical protein